MKKVSLSSLFSDFILTALLFVKCMIFYSQLHLGGFEFVFSAATVALVVTVSALVRLFSHEAGRIVFRVLYVFASCAMAIDAVYYAYVSKLPSVAQLGMVGQLDDISSTIMELIRVKHVLMIADFPFIILFRADKEELAGRIHFDKFNQIFRDTAIGLPKLCAAELVFAVIMFSFVFIYPEFETEYLVNELFIYHTDDIVSTLSSADEVREVDKSQYVSPDYSDSEYYGIAEGRNVIIIQVEAMQNFVIGAAYEGQEIMPNLNSLIAGDSIYFDNYYYQIGGGNTADAEFAVNNSLFAPESEAAYVKYPDNDYYPLAQILKDNGYSGAHAYHGYIGSFWNREYAYSGQGFDDYTSLEDLEQTDMFSMGLSDSELFRQSMEVVKTYEEPFYCFYVTVSSHYPYGIPEKDRRITLNAEDEETLFGLYLQAMNYADYAIGSFIDMLKEEGLYDNSIILIYGDHYALTNTDAANSTRVRALTGEQYTIFDVFNVPFIVNIPGCDVNRTISTAGGHIDVLPTLLCLLGIHNDKAVMFGQNLLEAESGFVCEQTHVSIGSFISDSVFFKKPHNNIKSNYDAYDRQTMERLDPDLFAAESDIAMNRILDCAALLKNNDVLLTEGD